MKNSTESITIIADTPAITSASFLAKLAVPSVAFLVPLLLNGPQLIIGTLINTYLILSTALYPRRLWPALAILPSLAALMHGYLFGPATVFLWYFLPFIWTGNLALMYGYRYFAKTVNAPVAVILSSLIKASWLFAIANVYVRLGIVPTVFLTAMGLVQLATALAGASIGYLIIAKGTKS